MPGLRELPSVDQVFRNLHPTNGLPETLVKNEIRNVLAERRRALAGGSGGIWQSVEEEVKTRLAELLKPGLRRVINATGVVLHTNLGRAPLPAFEPLAGYTNLEYDLATGRRGKRDSHVSPVLERLLGRPAVVVNNNAAAVYLVLNELAGGGEVIVSRGELIEIGDGFRIPDIMARSGAVLREVGTTNRTRIEDYERAIAERTRLILRVHRSNFQMSGFTERPPLEALATLGKERGIPVFEDLGSGCLVDLRAAGIHEPAVSESLAAGIDLISFSGDKLLGGPQAGIIAGDGALVRRVRRNPMYRAFRVDKLILQALETTLRHALEENWRAIPALAMILTPLNELRARAKQMAERLEAINCELCETESLIGGGSTPDQKLATCAIELSVPDAAEFERRLRKAETPVIARIEHDKIILDLRTVSEDEEEALVAAVLRARDLH